MSADELGPLDREPYSIRPPFDVRDDQDPLRWPVATSDEWRGQVRAYRTTAIREALTGVELGAYDERIIDWLAGWDVPTVGTIVSWLHRARQAGRDEAGSGS